MLILKLSLNWELFKVSTFDNTTVKMFCCCADAIDLTFISREHFLRMNEFSWRSRLVPALLNGASTFRQSKNKTMRLCWRILETLFIISDYIKSIKTNVKRIHVGQFARRVFHTNKCTIIDPCAKRWNR